MNRFFLSVLLLSILLAGGCAVRKSEVDQAVADTGARIGYHLGKAGATAPSVLVRPGQHWLAGHEIPLDPPLPPELRQSVSLAASSPASLHEIARRIAEVSHLPVYVEPDLAETVEAAGKPGPSAKSAGLPPLPPIPGLPTGNLPNLPAPDLGNAPTLQADGKRLAYRHDGPLHELLDRLAGRFGVAWEYRGGRIVLSRFQTRLFTLYLPPETRELEAEVGGKATSSEQSRGSISTGGSGGTMAASGGGGAGGGSGGGSGSGSGAGGNEEGAGQRVKAKASLDMWKEVEETVQRLLTAEGKFSAAPSSGEIVVTDTPAAVHRVGEYVAQKNATLTRQVAVQVDVLSVDAGNRDDFSIHWKMMFQNEALGGQLVTPDLVTGVTANLAMQIIRPNDQFNGSQAMIKALSSRLNSRLVTSTIATTLNNHPAPIQVTRTDGFLRSVSNTIAGLSGAVTRSMTPGQITTGFVMTVTPRILDRDRLLLSYSIDLSRLLGFTTASTGSGDQQASIQIPNFEKRAFIQAVAVRAGDTLVLSGFEQADDKADLAGPVHPDNSLFGSRQLERKRNRLVVLITPVLVGNGSV